jgi:Family of unknown function (DUF6263)
MNRCFLYSMFWCALCCSLANAADTKPKSANEKLEAATKKYGSDQPTYQLAYKFRPGEEFRTKITHLATVDTKVKGVEETMKSRSVSSKLWKIRKVEPNGNITFTHMIEWVDMWKSLTGRPESKYDSRTDAEVPADYEQVAKSIGVPLATITIDPIGRIVNRESAQNAISSSIGDLTVPFPAQPVKIGDSWHIPQDVTLRDEEGRVKPVQVRQRYTLEKVETGVATIVVKTQVLTPVNDPKLESQLIQRLQSGTVKFDIEAGRIIQRQMDLDETVLGFSGPESSMQYLARYSEEHVKDAVAAKPSAGKK